MEWLKNSYTSGTCPTKFDVAIIGAGSIGLASAIALNQIGLNSIVLDSQSKEELSNPKFDGRDLALSHNTQKVLKELGAWQLIEPSEITPLHQATVINGNSLNPVIFKSQNQSTRDIGVMVSNHIIRQALWNKATKSANIKLLPNTSAIDCTTSQASAQVVLDSGETFHADLLLGADARFSKSRKIMGISFDKVDYKKVMLVCRMKCGHGPSNIAYEIFDYSQTLALLPSSGNTGSCVVTLRVDEVDHLMALPKATFEHEMERRFGGRFGRMELISERFFYPLVGTYARRFIKPRFALVGDAAVGMHPVTAHGFNLGMSSIQTLAKHCNTAILKSQPFHGDASLQRYETEHKKEAFPLYWITNRIVSLYTDDRPFARLVRHIGMAAFHGTPFLKSLITKKLTTI
jgi:ubiquinone biosynthesis UbiH/UbiF/VisC/COQ6 family hydroxylase